MQEGNIEKQSPRYIIFPVNLAAHVNFVACVKFIKIYNLTKFHLLYKIA